MKTKETNSVMSESPHFTIAQLAADLVDARAMLATLKRESRTLGCEHFIKPDHSIGDSGEPMCFWNREDPDFDIDDACEPCRKRIEMQPKLEAASKASSKAWRDLKRAVVKTKKLEP